MLNAHQKVLPSALRDAYAHCVKICRSWGFEMKLQVAIHGSFGQVLSRSNECQRIKGHHTHDSPRWPGATNSKGNIMFDTREKLPSPEAMAWTIVLVPWVQMHWCGTNLPMCVVGRPSALQRSYAFSCPRHLWRKRGDTHELVDTVGICAIVKHGCWVPIRLKSISWATQSVKSLENELPLWFW